MTKNKFTLIISSIFFFATYLLHQIILMILQFGWSFSPACHLHDNARSQFHQKVLLLMKSSYIVFSSKEPFSIKQIQ